MHLAQARTILQAISVDGGDAGDGGADADDTGADRDGGDSAIDSSADANTDGRADGSDG
jgi:hypothetical protein